MSDKNISSNDSIDNSDIVEAIESTTRQLASIQRISDITPIVGADRIELATVQGFQCVIAKKDQFKIGDLVVYFQVDSILPQRPEFEFLRERKFKVKTIKLRKQISEGLIMPLSILDGFGKLSNSGGCRTVLRVFGEGVCNEYIIDEGVDLTLPLGVIKNDPEGKAEKALIEKERRSLTMRFLMNISAFRWIYLKLNEKKGPWPSWIPHTDETRIQVCARKIMDHYNEEWEITEKLDGQSATFFVHPMKEWGIKRQKFGVCSRKIWLKTPSDCRYWQSAKKFDIEAKLRKENERYSKHDVSITTQAEQCGPGIQGNKYKLQDVDLYVFNVIVDGKLYRYDVMADFCKDHGLKPVPLVNGSFIPSKDIGPNKTVMEVVNFMIALSQGNSALLDRPREGLVCRLRSDPTVSLKVINPLFKIEQEKEEDENESNESNE